MAFSFAEPSTGISWRLGETGDFRETGFLNVLDPRTRRRMPNPGIELDADQKAATIYVRYADDRRHFSAPFRGRGQEALPMRNSLSEFRQIGSEFNEDLGPGWST